MAKRGKVVSFGMTGVNAKDLIASITKDSSRIFFSDHALERLEERNISNKQAITCIKHGFISEGPYQALNGDWKVNLSSVSAGDHLTVAIAFGKDSKGNNIIVVTAF